MYDPSLTIEPCTVCGTQANIKSKDFGVGEIVDCVRCGDYRISHVTADEIGLPFREERMRALAGHFIRKMQAGTARPVLDKGFFEALKTRRLPTPSEASDNLLIWVAQQNEERPGRTVNVDYSSPVTSAVIGTIRPEDASWVVNHLSERKFINGKPGLDTALVNLSGRGWERYEEVKRAHIASRFAFFARRFTNPDLDVVYEQCLRQAVAETGYELRTVTQRAGLIDAVIENEIRRCRFLIADLSDDNAGAYWEAGFAEGLGKPVIYICRTKVGDVEKSTHFDTNHRQTVRWDMNALAQTAIQLKAVIRNTLLGDAVQSD
jgi:nucleoside 2-deoxyribosyltransferase